MILFPLTTSELADIQSFKDQDPARWTWNAKTIAHGEDAYRLVLGRFLDGDRFHAHIELLPDQDGDLARPVSDTFPDVRHGDVVRLKDGEVIRFARLDREQKPDRKDV